MEAFFIIVAGDQGRQEEGKDIAKKGETSPNREAKEEPVPAKGTFGGHKSFWALSSAIRQFKPGGWLSAVK